MRINLSLLQPAVFSIALLAGCVMTNPPASNTPATTIGPYPQPHGRILLLGKHRAQLLFNCQQSSIGGVCQFTHGASGRIIELNWKEQQMWQRSNETGHQQWQPIGIEALHQLGLVVHPATMMQLLNGMIPSWLHPTTNNRWQGRHHNARIQMRWHPDQQRLDITNLSKGAQIRLLLKE